MKKKWMINECFMVFVLVLTSLFMFVESENIWASTPGMYEASLSKGYVLGSEENSSYTLIPDASESAAEVLTITFQQDLASPSVLEIRVPAGMSFVGEMQFSDSFLQRGTQPHATFTVFDTHEEPGIQQGTGTYINESAGSYLLRLPPLLKNDTIRIQIDYDRRIWGRQSGVEICDTTALLVNHIVDDVSDIRKIENMFVDASAMTRKFSLYFPPSTEGGTSSVPLGGEAGFPIAIITPFPGSLYTSMAFERLVITFEKPKANNANVYADYIDGSLNEFIYDNVDVQENESQVILTITDFVESSFRFTGKFLFDQEAFATASSVSVNASIRLYPYIGEELLTSASIGTKTASVVSSEGRIELVVFNNAANNKSNAQADGMDLLGIMGIKNAGGSSVNNVVLEYLFDTTTPAGSANKAYVETVKIPYPSQLAQEPPVIDITFVDAQGEQGFTLRVDALKNAEDASGFLDFISVDTFLINEYDSIVEGVYDESVEYYIKKIRYTISRIEGLELLGSPSYGMPGSVYGYTGSATSNNTLKVFDAEGNLVSTSSETFINVSSSSIPYLIESITTNKQEEDVVNAVSNIVVSESVEIKAILGVHDYPYTASTIVNKPIVYFIKPTGYSFDVTKDVVVNKRKEEGEESVLYEYKLMKTLPDGSEIYKFTLSQGYSLFDVTYLRENTLKYRPNRSISIQFRITPGLEVENSSLQLEQLIFMEDENSLIYTGAGGSYEVFRKTDVYDLSVNSNYLAGASSSDVLNVVSSESDLIAEASIDVEGIFSKTISNLASVDEVEDFTYLLQIKNESEQRVSTEQSVFYLEIDDYFYLMNAIGNKQEQTYYEVYYSTTATMESVLTCNDWLESVEDYSNVSAIKIQGNLDYDYIPAFDWTMFEMKMALRNEITVDTAGEIIRLQAMEWEKYIGEDVNVDNVLKSVNEVSVDTKYVIAKNTEIFADVTGENEAMTQLELEELTSDLDMYIIDVQAYNVTLQNFGSVQGEADSVEYADANYAVEMQVNESNKVDLSQFSQEPIFLGQISKEQNTVRFDLAYYSNLFDTSTSRYILITLADLKGREVEVRLDIERKVDAQARIEEGIIGGRYYSAIQTNDSLTITQDSAFTAQYILYRSLDNLQIKLVQGEEELAFPKGTRITFVHTGMGGTSGVLQPTTRYYYSVLGDEALFLSNFREMDTTEIFDSDIESVVGVWKHEIQVVVDFTQVKASDLLAVGEYSLDIQSNATEGSQPFLVSSARETQITSSVVHQASTHAIVNSVVQTSEVVGFDYKHINQYAAIRLMVSDENGNIFDIPQGSYVVINGVAYPAAGEKYFIHTLGKLSSGNYTYMFVFPMDEINVGEIDVFVQTDLFISEERLYGLSNLIASDTDAFVSNPPSDLAIDVAIEQPLIQYAGEYKVPLTLKYNEYASNVSLKIKLYEKKDNGVYELVPPGTITSLNEAPSYYGLLSNSEVVKYQGGEIVAGEGEDVFELTLNVPPMESAKVYRIVVTSASGAREVSDIQNFILLPQ